MQHSHGLMDHDIYDKDSLGTAYHDQLGLTTEDSLELTVWYNVGKKTSRLNFEIFIN